MTVGKPHCRPEPQPMTYAVPWGSPDRSSQGSTVGGRGRYPQDASCRNYKSLFLGPVPSGRAATNHWERCRRICQHCPVLKQCTDVARTEWHAGFLAGFTELERAVRWGVAADGAPTNVWAAAKQFRDWTPPEPEPGGLFCARPLSYRIPEHDCAVDGCYCGRNPNEKPAQLSGSGREVPSSVKASPKRRGSEFVVESEPGAPSGPVQEAHMISHVSCGARAHAHLSEAV